MTTRTMTSVGSVEVLPDSNAPGFSVLLFPIATGTIRIRIKDTELDTVLAGGVDALQQRLLGRPSSSSEPVAGVSNRVPTP